jgi:hemoglobin-like flavoprotein
MKTEQIHHLRKSFDIVQRQQHIAALAFYRRLFEINPALRHMFRTPIEQQSQKLMDMLGLLVSLLEKPGALEAELAGLGARHAGYQVREEHYSMVGKAMLGMLAEVLGENWTPALRDTWAEFYGVAAKAMKQGASAVSSR